MARAGPCLFGKKSNENLHQPLVDQDHEPNFIWVYRPRLATAARKGNAKSNEVGADTSEGSWKSCPVCRKRLNNSITNLSTKGEQPFVNLVRRQFELQPPNASFQEAAPN